MTPELHIPENRAKLLRFRVLKTDRTYDYVHHKAAAEPFEDHLRRFFGRQCPAQEVERLSELDAKGVRQGEAFVGMSKRGVVLALGPPPRHVTPDLDSSRWVYWKNRFNRVLITFDAEGNVNEIRD